MQQDAQNPPYQRPALAPGGMAPPDQPPPTAAPAGGIPAGRFRQPMPDPQLSGQPQPPQQPAAPLQQLAPQPQGYPQPLSHAAQKQQARQELKQAIGHSNEILARAQTVFPFTLFPDTVTIDRGKLTIAHRFFFKVAEVTSIRIEDILNATANVGPIFGSLKIATRFFGGTDKVYTINYLHRSDTIKIKRILQGYIIALKKQIDCSVLPTSELARLLLELGADAPEER